MKNLFKLNAHGTAWSILQKISPFPFEMTRLVYFFAVPALLLLGVVLARGWVEVVSAFLLGSMFYTTFWNMVSYLVKHESFRVGVKARTRSEIEPWVAKFLQIDCTDPLYKEILKLILRK